VEILNQGCVGVGEAVVVVGFQLGITPYLHTPTGDWLGRIISQHWWHPCSVSSIADLQTYNHAVSTLRWA